MSTSCEPDLSYWGTSGRGVRSSGGELPSRRWAASEVEGVDCFRANHRRLSGSPGPPDEASRRSARHREALQEMGGSEALPTPPGLCARAGFPVPRQGARERNAALFWAARGTECCPFFPAPPIPGDPRLSSPAPVQRLAPT